MFHKPDSWQVCVATANSLEAYCNIVQSMFDDNVVTDERLFILDVYTKDVCEKYPAMAQDVRQHYHQIYHQLTHRWYHSIPNILIGVCQYLFREMI